MKLSLTRRRSPDARCAFCHDALEGVISSCPCCFTAFHRDCRGHLGKCPTIGCNTTFSEAPEVEVEHDEPRSLAGELFRERAYMGLLLAASLVAAPFAIARSSDSEGAIVFTLLMVVLVWNAWALG